MKAVLRLLSCLIALVCLLSQAQASFLRAPATSTYHPSSAAVHNTTPSVSAPASTTGKDDLLVVVNKSRYTLTVYKGNLALRQFWIALGENPRGPKVMAGDKRTPEGRYLLDYKKENSNFHRAIHISYPNDQDLMRSQALGVEPGSMVMIHGQPNTVTNKGVQRSNWTNGCIALLDHDMDELWGLVEPGTPIEIRP